MSIEVEGLRELVHDLTAAPGKLLPQVDGVLKKGANNIKEHLREDAAGSKHFAQIAPTISYDSAYRFQEPRYEVGPDKQRGGAASLANIAYFGGVNGGGGTLDLEAPVTVEAPKLERELGKIMGDLL